MNCYSGSDGLKRVYVSLLCRIFRGKMQGNAQYMQTLTLSLVLKPYHVPALLSLPLELSSFHSWARWAPACSLSPTWGLQANLVPGIRNWKSLDEPAAMEVWSRSRQNGFGLTPLSYIQFVVSAKLLNLSKPQIFHLWSSNNDVCLQACRLNKIM